MSVRIENSVNVTSASQVKVDATKSAQLALKDIFQGITQWRLCLLLAYQDIKLRYRRSKLGPFWLTLSMAVTIYSMGFLYSYLFKSNIQEYFPYLAAGMLSWNLISSLVTELADALASSEHLVKQIKLPYTVHIYRVVYRNLIIFLHNIVIMVPLYIIFYHNMHINFAMLLIIPGLIWLSILAVIFGISLALIGARYRDVAQIIKNLIQVAFFMTPVMWQVQVLPQKLRLMEMFNPFYTLIELLRAPLLGQVLSVDVCFMAMALTVIGSISALCLFIKYRARIIYWL